MSETIALSVLMIGTVLVITITILCYILRESDNA